LNNYGYENAKNCLFVYSSRYIVIKQLFAGDVNLRPSFMINIARSISAVITSRAPWIHYVVLALITALAFQFISVVRAVAI